MRAARAGPATAAPGSAATAPGPEPERFRQVLGHFCTGVTVITTVGPGGRPHGFTCQSFAALSLDPPLVLFCPSRASATWPRIARAGHFCANVLTRGPAGPGQGLRRRGRGQVRRGHLVTVLVGSAGARGRADLGGV
jgi:hypothetical protein